MKTIGQAKQMKTSYSLFTTRDTAPDSEGVSSQRNPFSPKESIRARLVRALAISPLHPNLPMAEFAYISEDWEKADTLLELMGIGNNPECNHIQHLKYGGKCYRCEKVFYKRSRSPRPYYLHTLRKL